MAIELDKLVKALKQHAPLGTELPRDPDTNEVDEETIERWAQDAAGNINARRSRTTLKEAEITLVAGQQDYDLPDDAREVVRVDRGRDAPGRALTTLDIPLTSPAILTPAFMGSLPSGQEISPALDLIARQRLTQARREDDFELMDGGLRVLFDFAEGEIVRVRYKVIDRDFTGLGEDRFETILTYLRWKALDWYINKNAAGSVGGDRAASDAIATLTRQERQLFGEWTTALGGIGPEAAG